MQKLTRTTWKRTLRQDFQAIGIVSWRALIDFLTFKYRSMIMHLLLVFIFIRYEHELVERDTLSDVEGDSDLPS